MPKLISMVGPAGSGKSTIALRIASQMKEEVMLLSSDAIRGEIYGDENCQRDPGRVFDIMHQRTVVALSQGISVIYDATNLSCKRRMNFLKSIAPIDCRKECVVVVTTPEDIEERMKSRDRKVPMEVVHKQLCQFQCPNYYEGWDDIRVVYNSSLQSCATSYLQLREECYISHDNPHHSLSIAEHMSRAGECILQNEAYHYVEDFEVARIHDIGKPRCKSFTDGKGNPSEIAHYFGHQNYGAYYTLIWSANKLFPSACTLDNVCLVQWHMEHYLRKGKALERFYEMIGPSLTKRLHVLEKADMAAH